MTIESMSEDTKVGVLSRVDLLTKLEQCPWIEIEVARAGNV